MPLAPTSRRAAVRVRSAWPLLGGLAGCVTQIDEPPLWSVPSPSFVGGEGGAEAFGTPPPAALPVGATPPGGREPSTVPPPTDPTPPSAPSPTDATPGAAGVPIVLQSGGAAGESSEPEPPVDTAPSEGGEAGESEPVGSGGETSPAAAGSTAAGSAGEPTTDPIETDGSELFVDDFEDGDADDWMADASDGEDLVGDWRVVPGNGGFVYQQATSFEDASYTFAGETSWTDVTLAADVAFLTTSDGDASEPVGEDGFVYVLLRRALREGSDDDFNYVVVEFRSDGQFRIRRRLDGSSGDPIADWTNLGFQSRADQWHHIEVSVVGNAVTLFYGDLEVLDGVVPDGLESGQIGLGVVDATISIDNVIVSAP